MTMRFFWIPAVGGEAEERALNEVCARQRVARMERHFCPAPPAPGWAVCLELVAWLEAERGLELKPSGRIGVCAEGLAFLGYRVLPGGLLLGRRGRRRWVRRLDALEAAYAAGALDEAGRRRRIDAALAWVDLARSRGWKRRVLAGRPAAGKELPV